MPPMPLMPAHSPREAERKRQVGSLHAAARGPRDHPCGSAGEPRPGGRRGLGRQAAPAGREGTAPAVSLLRSARPLRAPQRAPRSGGIPAARRRGRAPSPAQDRLSPDERPVSGARPGDPARGVGSVPDQRPGAGGRRARRGEGGRRADLRGGRRPAARHRRRRARACSARFRSRATRTSCCCTAAACSSYRSTRPAGSGSSPGRSQAYPPDPVTRLTEVDVSDPAKLTVVRTQRVRGLFVSARLTGAIARVVVTSPPRAVGEPELRPRLKGWLAHTTVAQPAHRPEANAPGHALPRGPPRAGLLRTRHAHRARRSTWTGVCQQVDSDAVMTGAELVYASPRRLYVATQRWIAAVGDRARTCDGGTTIHEFDAADSAETHLPRERRGAGLPAQPVGDVGARRRAEGREHRGPDVARRRRERGSELRDHARPEGRSPARLGQVGGLGKGERIYSVRFIDDIGYVVTFRQVDPALHRRSLHPGRAEGARRAEDPRLLRLPPPRGP